MDDDTQRELYFLVAKFLRSQFPDIGDLFIKECENKKLFPSCVFSTNPSFEELDSHSLSGIPNDQLMRLVQMALPKTQFPSLFYTPPNTNQQVSTGKILSKQIGAPLPYFYGISPIQRVIGHFHRIFCLAVDLTSQILISGADDSLIKIWKLPQLSLLATVHAHKQFVTDISIHPSNKFFASSSQDMTFAIIKLEDCQVSWVQGFQGPVNAVRFSPDGQLIAAATEDGTIQIFTLAVDIAIVYSKIMHICVPNSLCANWISFSPASKFFSFVTGGKSVVIVCPSTQRFQRLDGHTDMVDMVTFSSQSCRRLFSHSPKDKSIRVWAEMGGIFQEQIDISPRNVQNLRAKAIKVSWNCDETHLVSISASQIVVWKQNGGSPQAETCTYGTEKLTVLAMHPFLPNIAFVGCDNGHVSIWDIYKLEALVKMQVNDSPHITEAIWTNDGQYIIASDSTGGITIFGKSQEPFTTTQEVFQNDNNKEVYLRTEKNQPILNRAGVQLNPQPKTYIWSDLQLNVIPTPLDPAIIAEEEDLIGLWDANDVRKLIPDPDPQLVNFFHYNEMEEDNSLPPDIMAELEAEEQLPQTHRRAPAADAEEDGDFVVSQHIDEEEEEEETDEEMSPQPSLPKTRSAGPIPDEEPMHFRSRTRSHDYLDGITNDDFLDEVEGQMSDESEEAQFSEEEEIRRTKPKPKIKPKPKTRSSSRRNRSYSGIISDKIVYEDNYQNNSSEVELSQSDYDAIIAKDTTNYQPIYNEPLPEVNTPIPTWMFNDKRYQHTFVPQIGERIVYIKSGHQKVADECNVKKCKAPYQTIKNMPEISTGYVNYIECDPNFLYTTITLDLKRGFKTGTVAFPINESQPFLIPLSLFNKGIEYVRTLNEGDIVEITFSEDGKITPYKASIKSIRPDFETKPYESVIVQLIDTDDKYEICPWEIMLNEQEPNEIGNMAQLMTNSVQALMKMEEYAPFVYVRSDEQKEAVWKHLSFPMDLELFLARLTNGWYQTLNEMKTEVSLFYVNASYLGQPIEIAQDLSDRLNTMIDLKAKVAQVDDVIIPTE